MVGSGLAHLISSDSPCLWSLDALSTTVSLILGDVEQNMDSPILRIASFGVICPAMDGPVFVDARGERRCRLVHAIAISRVLVVGRLLASQTVSDQRARQIGSMSSRTCVAQCSAGRIPVDVPVVAMMIGCEVVGDLEGRSMLRNRNLAGKN